MDSSDTYTVSVYGAHEATAGQLVDALGEIGLAGGALAQILVSCP